MPSSDQDASGELPTMDVGAALWGLFGHTGRIWLGITRTGRDRLPIRLLERALASGQRGFRQGARHRAFCQGLAGSHSRQHAGVGDFYDDIAGHFDYNTYLSINPYERTATSTLNTRNIIPAISSMQRLPELATATTAAVRSRRSSMPMPFLANNGSRRRRMSIAMPASFSPPLRSKNSREKS